MCIRDRLERAQVEQIGLGDGVFSGRRGQGHRIAHATQAGISAGAVSYTHLRAHETVLDLVCRLLLEKKNKCNLHTTDTTKCTLSYNRRVTEHRDTLQHTQHTREN